MLNLRKPQKLKGTTTSALHWPENMEIPAVNLKVKSVVNMFAIVVSHTYNADFIYTALT